MTPTDDEVLRAELDAIERANAVYWRVYLSDRDGWVPVCMQWFDECHYDQSRFYSTDHYPSEGEALRACYAARAAGFEGDRAR